MSKSRVKLLLFVVQFVPPILVMLTIVACSGGDYPHPTSNIFLRGFSATSTVGVTNGNSPLPFQQITTDHPSNVNTSTGSVSVPTIFAVIAVGNGVSATITKITVHFSEQTGEPLQDVSTTPPTIIGSNFDLIMTPTITVEAPPIALTSGLGEPTGNFTNLFIPINPLGSSGMLSFAYPVAAISNSNGVPVFGFVNGFNSRPYQCTITLQGQDIFGHAFSLAGSLLVDQLVGPLIIQ